jgi:hypothetical protein
MNTLNKDIWSFFDRKVLLTVPKRKSGKPPRLPVVSKELYRVGLYDYEVFNAVDSIGPHQSFNLSQKQILTDFIKSDSKILLTLEDDVEFHDLEPLRAAITDIKLNNIKWDVLYLGGNIQGRVTDKSRRSIKKVNNVLTTHAVAYTRFAAAGLLQHFPDESVAMFDTYLAGMQSHLNTYMVYPIVAYQRPDFSEIWQNDVNYTSIFRESNRKMQ